MGWVSLLAGLLVAHSRLPGVVMETIRTAALKQTKGSLKYGKFNQGPQTLNQGCRELKKIIPKFQTPTKAACLTNA